jgi:NIMA (never in mitosis gene a)-related kinase 2
MSQKEREQLHAEFQILSSLRHPNIVAYYQREHLKASQDLHLYMEYCGNGDLGRVIKELKIKNKVATEEFAWSIFAQLVTALYRCHYGVDPPEVGMDFMGDGSQIKPPTMAGKTQVMILHRDLKPENGIVTPLLFFFFLFFGPRLTSNSFSGRGQLGQAG